MALIACDRCGERLDAVARFCGACGAEIRDPNIQRTVAGRYVLRERIASGSLGIVYAAEQIGVGRKVAIKMLPADSNRDVQTVERFRREGEVLCKLRSPHTVTTYEFDREPDGSLYIAMELSAGQSLAHVLRREGPMPWPRVMKVLQGLCDSLGEAHAMGIIHRDLKPENILVEERATNRQFVKVSDFGLAKVMAANLRISPVGQNVGSIEFSSPEQLLDRPLDARSDLYGLGVLAFLLISGVHPFAEARTFGEMVASHIQKMPPRLTAVRPDVPPDVEALIACLLEKDPNRRYPDTATLSAQLGLLLTGTPPEPGATIRTDESEEDTLMADMPVKPK